MEAGIPSDFGVTFKFNFVVYIMRVYIVIEKYSRTAGKLGQNEGFLMANMGVDNFTSPANHETQNFLRLENGIDHPRVQHR